MARYVAFLRAVNVGKRRVEMCRLRAVLEGLGHRDCWTFLNSGNAVFSASGRRSTVGRDLEAALREAFGFEIPTFLRSDAEVRTLAATKPFGPVPAGSTHMVVLLRAPLSPTVAAEVSALSSERDRLVVDGSEVHWLIDGKLMDSALTARDWKVLGDQLTTSRNATMLTKLAAKLDG